MGAPSKLQRHLRPVGAPLVQRLPAAPPPGLGLRRCAACARVAVDARRAAEHRHGHTLLLLLLLLLLLGGGGHGKRERLPGLWRGVSWLLEDALVAVWRAVPRCLGGTPVALITARVTVGGGGVVPRVPARQKAKDLITSASGIHFSPPLPFSRPCFSESISPFVERRVTFPSVSTAYRASAAPAAWGPRAPARGSGSAYSCSCSPATAVAEARVYIEARAASSAPASRLRGCCCCCCCRAASGEFVPETGVVFVPYPSSKATEGRVSLVGVP